jgi:hypothetical protein
MSLINYMIFLIFMGGEDTANDFRVQNYDLTTNNSKKKKHIYNIINKNDILL